MFGLARGLGLGADPPPEKKARKASELTYPQRSLIPHPILQPTYQLYLNSDQRLSGDVNNATFTIVQPFPRNIFACSIKEFCFLNTIYTLQTSMTWAVIYTANPSAFPTQITLTKGTYSYGYGTVTYAMASPTIPDIWMNDIRYVLLNAFQGAIASIVVSSITNSWTIHWNPSTVSTAWNVLLTTPALFTIFNLPPTTSAALWSTLGPVNLSPPNQVAFASYQLDNQQLRGAVGENSWTCVIDVDSGPGDVVFHTPKREEIARFGKPLDNLSTIDVSIQNPLDNSLIQGLTWWSVLLRLYQDEYVG
jgi:hypothetical protein